VGWRGTLVLALLVALAGAAYLLSPGPPPELSDSNLLGEPRFLPVTTPSPHLLDFSPAGVERLTLGYRDEVVTVAKQGDGWRGAADARPLDDFVQSLAQASVISAIPEGGELADFGLDAPARRILIETTKGASLVLLIGDRNPAGTSVYVRVDDGPVVIAGALLVWEFDKAFAAITGRKALL